MSFFVFIMEHVLFLSLSNKYHAYTVNYPACPSLPSGVLRSRPSDYKNPYNTTITTIIVSISNFCVFFCFYTINIKILFVLYLNLTLKERRAYNFVIAAPRPVDNDSSKFIYCAAVSCVVLDLTFYFHTSLTQ